ncbi:hypothetical protein HMSSN036_47890 [Paenibacillus macerans]|uniref:Uncharacterized protein n=1 Tax=Paenibacillus macerans TaxID=44252 RepID=A0A090ZEK4_PAEMA|nr:hypothetical protein [Paenibacillus macerans]KFN08635.1 hypothetical protein DJ90_5345 [Paenibacillus macerans]MBS5913036.1 hypothetical protein [Paenibacillus macerans]MDU5946933.1 hypothetical protein [Paenibacillus macerans]MDU7475235.1 hypothetical protein [Paenibacillus macerans]MEC0139854.1 hypothetical protein [Paenibacillus macerans]
MKPEDKQEQYVSKQIKDAASGEFPGHKDISEAENGSMVNDMEDLIQLGEDMKQLEKGREDANDGFKPDPLQ